MCPYAHLGIADIIYLALNLLEFLGLTVPVPVLYRTVVPRSTAVNLRFFTAVRTFINLTADIAVIACRLNKLVK